jgi:hypothetical protein
MNNQIIADNHGNITQNGNIIENQTLNNYSLNSFSFHDCEIDKELKITNNHQLIRLNKSEWIVKPITNKNKPIYEIDDKKYLPVIIPATITALFKNEDEIEDVLGEVKSYMVTFHIYNKNGSIKRTENKFFKKEDKAIRYLINTLKDLENLI